MRCSIIAVLALTACSQPAAEDPVAEDRILTFEGADYGDNRDAMLAHGERLSWVLNCRGCHEPDLTGKKFPPGVPFDTGVYTSNLTQVVDDYSEEQLERLLREGVHPKRDTLWMMPSYLYRHLSEPDMAALVAHLKTLEPMGKPTPASEPTEMLRQSYGSADHPLKSAETLAWADALPLDDPGDQFAFGRHLASMTCAECHGPDLRGIGEFSPDLHVMGAAYSDDELRALLSEGTIKGGRDVYLMDRYGRNIAAKLTDAERSALIGFVKALGAAQMAEGPQ